MATTPEQLHHDDMQHTLREVQALLARGVEKGDRVGIWAPNRYEWVVVQYATARIGAILVNVNPAYKATELEYALRKVPHRSTAGCALKPGARPRR